MGGALGWHTAVAACQGASHIELGAPCQDKVFAGDYPNGATVIALADGAGSAKYSHYGAELVARRTSEMIAKNFDAVFAKNISNRQFAHWLVSGLQWELLRLSSEGIAPDAADRERLELPAEEEQPLVACEVYDLASTLLLVAVKGSRYICLHLGDGVVGVSVASARGFDMRVLSGPANGEFANETVFTTSTKAELSLRVLRGSLWPGLREIDGFILMSDGPEASLFHKRTYRLAPACGKLLDACRCLPKEEMEQALEHTLVGQIAKRTSDDCSLALLAR